MKNLKIWCDNCVKYVNFTNYNLKVSPKLYTCINCGSFLKEEPKESDLILKEAFARLPVPFNHLKNLLLKNIDKIILPPEQLT